MDEVQAEAAAEALLASERAKRKPRRLHRRAPYTRAERRLMSAWVLVGAAVGFTAALFGGGSGDWAAAGVIGGAVVGFCVAAAIVSGRRAAGGSSDGDPHARR